MKSTILEFKIKIGEDGTFRLPKTIDRRHAVYIANDRVGGYSNSVLFPALVKRVLSQRDIYDTELNAGSLPAGVTIISRAFLSTVQVDMSPTA